MMVLPGFHLGFGHLVDRVKGLSHDLPMRRDLRVGMGTPITKDRKGELVKIAYRLIAQKGLEGFRIRQVAAEAGIDNGTLHYHFPSKEALIQGVVDYLVRDLETNRTPANKNVRQTALSELRLEFEDIGLRLRDTPEQLVVLSELAIRSWRDPALAKIFRKLDDGWYAHLVNLLERGIQQGIFRKDLSIPPCVRAIMVALRGIVYQSRLPRRELDLLLSQLAAQTEYWIVAGNSVRRK
jgi:AcrR family transcriptional regulator